ncbi:MAG: RIP metalloprotease RseP [Kiritimatiellia bacterium]|jgi:regulator of sigma E protease|nr:RIP metalloprotease RseP [Kiritimatiellia bacterium]
MLGSIITNFRDVIALVLLFSFTIFVHELGHFLVALKCGMVIDVFSIGFGPAMWKKKVNGITYKIGWIPFGGYVALPQLDPSGMSSIQGEDEEGEEKAKEDKPVPRELPDILPWKKILVSVAGATGNIIFAIILATVIWLSPDAVTYRGGTVVGGVDSDSASYKAGLRKGDVILAINRKPVGTWYEVSLESLLVGPRQTVNVTVLTGETQRDVELTLVEKEGSEIPIFEGVERQPDPCLFASVFPDSPAAEAGLEPGDIVRSFDGTQVDCTDHFIDLVSGRGDEAVPIVVERDGELVEAMVTPKYNEEVKRALIGVRPVGLMVPWMQYKHPVRQVGGDASGIVRLLKALVNRKEAPKAAKGLGGPVAILATLWLSIKISLFNAIGFLRFLNVNLAILNLLPIPVLDGGHIVFSLWEGISRRKAHPKLVNALINVFAVLLIGVFVLLTFRDVDRIFPGLKRIFRRGDDEPAVEQVETNAILATNAVTGADPGTAE